MLHSTKPYLAGRSPGKHQIPIEYYRIATNGIQRSYFETGHKIPPPECGTNAFTCSIQVDNFDSTSGKILELGGQVALPKFAVPGRCWQGYFYGSDNNVLAF